MKNILEYDRDLAVSYARKWALGRNPSYKDYDPFGGDCTNFISQCMHAGKIPFDSSNKDEWLNWYWYSDKKRTPSWTAAEAFYQYLINNNKENTKNHGVYARRADYNELEPGDIVQLIYEGRAYHTMIVTEVLLEDEYLLDYLICQHTADLLDYPLGMKEGEKRYIKILGYYKY